MTTHINPTDLETAVRKYAAARGWELKEHSPDVLKPEGSEWTMWALELTTADASLHYMRQVLVPYKATQPQRVADLNHLQANGKQTEILHVQGLHRMVTIDYHPDNEGYVALVQNGTSKHYRLHSEEDFARVLEDAPTHPSLKESA